MGNPKPLLLSVAAASAVIGLLGLVDLGNAPYAGFFTGPANDVVRIFPDSPAEAAGLQVGDVIESIGGIAITDTKAQARRLRPEIGESRSFVVQRDGVSHELDLVYSALPSTPRNLAIAGGLIGFCFLILPLWAYFRASSGSTLVLALFGLCFGIAFLPGPYSKSFLLRTVGGALATSAVILGFAFLVHYLLRFPTSRGFLDRSVAKKIIYGPAILLAFFFLVLAAAQPDATGAFNTVVGLLVGVFIVGFFGWAVVAMIQTFARADAEERRRHGLTLMLFGTLAGLLPVTFSSLLRAVAPQAQANLPGLSFYFLTLGLIPLCFAIAAVRSAASGPGKPAGA